VFPKAYGKYFLLRIGIITILKSRAAINTKNIEPTTTNGKMIWEP
jgi:hypothetical protein